MWLPRYSPPFLAERSRHSLRFSLTSRRPTVIWVGRSSVIFTGFRMGSRGFKGLLLDSLRRGRRHDDGVRPPRHAQAGLPRRPRRLKEREAGYGWQGMRLGLICT